METFDNLFRQKSVGVDTDWRLFQQEEVDSDGDHGVHRLKNGEIAFAIDEGKEVRLVDNVGRELGEEFPYTLTGGFSQTSVKCGRFLTGYSNYNKKIYPTRYSCRRLRCKVCGRKESTNRANDCYDQVVAVSEFLSVRKNLVHFSVNIVDVMTRDGEGKLHTITNQFGKPRVKSPTGQWKVDFRYDQVLAFVHEVFGDFGGIVVLHAFRFLDANRTEACYSPHVHFIAAVNPLRWVDSANKSKLCMKYRATLTVFSHKWYRFKAEAKRKVHQQETYELPARKVWVRGKDKDVHQVDKLLSKIKYNFSHALVLRHKHNVKIVNYVGRFQQNHFKITREKRRIIKVDSEGEPLWACKHQLVSVGNFSDHVRFFYDEDGVPWPDEPYRWWTVKKKFILSVEHRKAGRKKKSRQARLKRLEVKTYKRPKVQQLQGSLKQRWADLDRDLGKYIENWCDQEYGHPTMWQVNIQELYGEK